MVLELFTICEGAFAKNGQLTIVNTLDNILSKQFPMILNLGVAIKLKLSKEEYGKHEVCLAIANNDGVNIAPEMKVTPEVVSPNKFCNLVMSTNVQGVRIEKPGMYSVIISVDGNQMSKASLEIKGNG